MSKKNIIVVTVTLLTVAGFYYYLLRDSFHGPHIQISHTIRPSHSKRVVGVPIDAENDSINFGLNGDYKLTSIKTVPNAEYETNKFAHPTWELTTDSNSIPTRVFSYGMHIKGMHSTVKGAVPAALEPNTTYRLLVEAGPVKGDHIFTVPEINH